MSEVAAHLAQALQPIARLHEEFGGFRIDGVPVALPIAVLREVRVRGELQPLPCSQAAVVGGLDLRGCVVPVLDLAVVLGRQKPSVARAQVVVVAAEGLLLGLAVDEVTGIFRREDPERPLPEDAVDGQLYWDSVRRADTGDLVALLSLRQLLTLPGLPRVRQPAVQAPAAQGRVQARHPMLLLRCGSFNLAVDALAVQATLDRPRLEPSALVRDPCRGVLAHADRWVPAVDLSALCGFGALQAEAEQQAFVLKIGEGLVAFLVSEVQDVVQTEADKRVPLSGLGLPVPSLFHMALAASVRLTGQGLTGGGALREPAGLQAPYLVLAAGALKMHPLLMSLAAANTPLIPKASAALAGASLPAGQVAQGGKGVDSQARNAQVITFELGGEVAVPIEQVTEILRFTTELAVFEGGQPLMGLLLNRGRSIPLFCPFAMAGRPRQVAASGNCVLVVQVNGAWVGFVVPALRGIEAVNWAPHLGATRMFAKETVAVALGSTEAVLVGGASGERMLRLLDLQALALGLLEAHLVA